jgi:putative hydrolase of the HAD superfamily
VFSDFPIDKLRVTSEVIAIVKSLASNYKLVLVTEGRASIQKEKIRHLGIYNLFDDVLIIDPADRTSKEAVIKNYMMRQNIMPRHAVIVGNRLDREIIAGNRLGILTIWIRSGEGSEMEPNISVGKADADIDDIADLPTAIETLVGQN